jgi:hypothetical protein
MDEDFASSAQPNSARQALEQLRAEFCLEVGDPPVDRGRCYVEVFGSLPDRTSTRNFVNVSQNPKVLHGVGGF